MSDNVCDVKLKKLRYLDKLRLSEAGKASDGNIEIVWDSAVATNTFFQALFMEKVPGKVRKRRTLFCQALFY